MKLKFVMGKEVAKDETRFHHFKQDNGIRDGYLRNGEQLDSSRTNKCGHMH